MKWRFTANLNTYVISYMRTEVSSKISYADWVYFSTTDVTIQGIAMPVAGIVSKKIGIRLSLVIGSLFYR